MWRWAMSSGRTCSTCWRIIGVATLVGPIPVDPEFLRFDLWVMLAASLLLIPFVFFRRDITPRLGRCC